MKWSLLFVWHSVSSYIFHAVIPSSNTKNILKCRRPLRETVSPTVQVSKQYAQKDRQAVLRRRGSVHCGGPACQLHPKGADHHSGHCRNLSDSWMLYSYEDAGHGFLSFLFQAIQQHITGLAWTGRKWAQIVTSSSSAPVPSLFSCHV